jgi:hypothetical protein
VVSDVQTYCRRRIDSWGYVYVFYQTAPRWVSSFHGSPYGTSCTPVSSLRLLSYLTTRLSQLSLSQSSPRLNVRLSEAVSDMKVRNAYCLVAIVRECVRRDTGRGCVWALLPRGHWDPLGGVSTYHVKLHITPMQLHDTNSSSMIRPTDTAGGPFSEIRAFSLISWAKCTQLHASHLRNTSLSNKLSEPHVSNAVPHTFATRA